MSPLASMRNGDDQFGYGCSIRDCFTCKFPSISISAAAGREATWRDFLAQRRLRIEGCRYAWGQQWWWRRRRRLVLKGRRRRFQSSPTRGSTMGQNQVILRHQKFAFPRAREWAKWASERTSEGSGGREQSEQSETSERVSGASERANGRASGPVFTSVFFSIFDHSALLIMISTESEATLVQASATITSLSAY